jgi:hypothetical protein
MANPVAVLTGDLIASSAAPPEAVDRAMAELADTVGRMAGWNIGVDPRFTRWRGDGWQVMVRAPGYGLRAALCLIASLRAAKLQLSTRVSLGIGSLDHPGTTSLADARGSAFLTSGRALDQMKKPQRIAISGEAMTPLHQGYGDLLAAITQRWSGEQAEAMVHALHPDQSTLSDIAAELGISPQAVGYRLKGSFGAEIRHALRAWEEDMADAAVGAAAS